MRWIYCQHSDVTPLLSGSLEEWLDVVFQFRHNAPQTLVLIVSKECQFWPLLDEVAVGVDRVRLREFFFYERYDGLKVLFGLECAEFNLG